MTWASADGVDDDVEKLLAGRCTFQYQAFFHGSTVGQYTVDGKRGEKPPLDAVVTEHLSVADIVLIGLGLAVDDDAKHVLNGIAMAIERRALQRVAVGHVIIYPLLVQFFEGQLAIGPERIDNPDVLIKNLSWFHDCKGTKKI